MRPSKRELERRVDALEDTDRDGFHFFEVDATGDRDADRGGFYQYDPDRDEYVNENGHTRTDAPASGFDFTITYATE